MALTVKQRIKQLNGRILLNSIPGTGSRFTLILPQTGAASVDDLAAEWLANHQESSWPSQQPTAEKTTRETAPPPVNKTAEQIRTPTEKPPQQEDSRATILVVDDDRANRMVANASLRKQYTILEAESGMQCLNQLETEPVDLVLLDLMMPDMSGFEVLEEMKAHPERRYPPVIVLSALMDSKTISHTLQLGAVDYLTKPFNREEILARVHSQIILAQRELHLEYKVQQRTKQLQESNQRLEETFQQLLQSEKMASIGQLAAGVAHEINNPVGFIHSNLSTLSEYLDAIGTLLGNYKDLGQAVSETDTQKVQLLLEQINALRAEEDIDFILEDIPGLVADTREGTERVKSIVQGMKAFSRADDGEMAEADINAGIEATLKVVWNELKYKTEVHKSLGALPKTFCNLNQLNQAFTNLLVNAAHAIEEHGDIDIRTQQVGDEIIIEIADTGSGIESKHLQSLFDPFFTTKPVGQGTGLGLYLSYEIIQKHRGSIDVQSEVGKGTRFTIRLPIVSAN
ncbi:MAG: hybrid sensor histidine kinase/response regulator [endosymbiont of Seepiophila jonesi]|uniref:histidine kinase n=1 Tax=endosymbiont of Lamellibrachia luymesi TaxID=2200907 RepID=A0A370DAE0_9GAMM|nr:MAG: hybrid sensor histidine kinase/response regulator [endosymbiont of Lamellibrachia luymesi]RDH92120.1 MAG: hybrid sensor histidine kinase/response regulator [endosymbiont of Seepiophila jonesi]